MVTNDICAWLEELGLTNYQELFVENEIDLDAARDLNESDLRELGIPMGPRKKMLRAIASIADINILPTEPEPENIQAGQSGSIERRHLTIMFIDLVGSTEMSNRLDPEEMREVIIDYQNSVAKIVGKFVGLVARYMGDGVLTYFGWPNAHEDDAERAIRAALAIMQTIDGKKTPSGEALSARAGISTGIVVVGDLIGQGIAQEEAVVGATPNLAARLQSIAGPGQIVLSEDTKKLVSGQFDLTELPALELKGIDGLLTAYKVNGERVLESRFDARATSNVMPLIGREQELALLKERWRLAKVREGQMVFLTGEAGIGKSRITRALIDTIAGDKHFRVSYQCSPYHSDSTLHPAIQQLNVSTQIELEDSNETKLDKLEDLLMLGEETDAESIALIAELIGLEGDDRYGKLDLTPQQQRNRTLYVLAGQLIGLSRSKPVLFILEDAHWIDETTLELLSLCLDQIAEARVLIVVTARPTFEHKFGGHPFVTRLNLNRLSREHVVGITNRLTRGKSLPKELLDDIVIKSDGIPLFVEELTKTLLESGELTETSDSYLLENPMSRPAIPATLHDSLMARLDRIQPVKRVAQVAACIGREFSYRLLHAISPLEEFALQDALDQLSKAELVFRRGELPEARYTFKHALVRDTAYESLLHTERQILHAEIAKTLETEFLRIVDTEPELVAYHFANACDFNKALYYWKVAAKRGIKRSAHRDAIEHLKKGLEVLPQLPESGNRIQQEAELQADLGIAYTATKGQAAPEVETAYLRARKLCQQGSDTVLLFTVLRRLWLCYQVGSKLDAAQEIGHELLTLTQSHENSIHAVEAYRALGQTALWRGDYSDSREYFQCGLDLYDPEVHAQNAFSFGQDPYVVSSCCMALSMWILGFPDQARLRMQECRSYADQLDHPYSHAVDGIMSTFICTLLRDVEKTQAEAERTIKIATDYELPFFLAFGTVYHGRTRALQGLTEDGMAQISRGFDMPVPKTEAWWHYALIDICIDAGLEDESQQSLNKALSIVDRTGDRLIEAELHRLKGELQLQFGEKSTRENNAEASFQKAISIARSQYAKSWELRTTISLARLWRDQNKTDDARELLTPIYRWFTEGFDTLDLKDAKALLDEIS